MNITLISDTHNEFDLRFNYKWLERIEKSDVMVLAGDICSAGQWSELVRYCSGNFANTLLIPGNHDYYGYDVDEAEGRFEASLIYDNVFNLNNGTVELKGQRFVGHTMWFRDDPINFRYQRQLNDFYQIGGFNGWVYDENSRAQNILDKIEANDIVVTHHLPTYHSVPDEYRADQLNRFYVCNQERLILEHQPRLWLHGHTHTACDYNVEKTRVVCNPLGYPAEANPMNCGKVIEI
jgi:predicted phosphodiesterase